MANLNPEQQGNITLYFLDNNVSVTDTNNNVPPYKYNFTACDQISIIFYAGIVGLGTASKPWPAGYFTQRDLVLSSSKDSPKGTEVLSVPGPRRGSAGRAERQPNDSSMGTSKRGNIITRSSGIEREDDALNSATEDSCHDAERTLKITDFSFARRPARTWCYLEKCAPGARASKATVVPRAKGPGPWTGNIMFLFLVLLFVLFFRCPFLATMFFAGFLSCPVPSV